jgi:hypothetical protein
MKRDLFHGVFGHVSPDVLRGNRYTSPADLECLVALARSIGAKHFMEFGVAEGWTAALMEREVETLRHYTGFDVTPTFTPALAGQRSEVPSEGRLAWQLTANKVRRYDTMKITALPAGTAMLAGSDVPKADIAWIDGDHSREGVLRDTELARAAVPEGILAWHDYGNASVEVTAALDSLSGLGWPLVHVEGGWLVFMFCRAHVRVSM